MMNCIPNFFKTCISTNDSEPFTKNKISKSLSSPDQDKNRQERNKSFNNTHQPSVPLKDFHHRDQPSVRLSDFNDSDLPSVQLEVRVKSAKNLYPEIHDLNLPDPMEAYWKERGGHKDRFSVDKISGKNSYFYSIKQIQITCF